MYFFDGTTHSASTARSVSGACWCVGGWVCNREKTVGSWRRRAQGTMYDVLLRLPPLFLVRCQTTLCRCYGTTATPYQVAWFWGKSAPWRRIHEDERVEAFSQPTAVDKKDPARRQQNEFWLRERLDEWIIPHMYVAASVDRGFVFAATSQEKKQDPPANSRRLRWVRRARPGSAHSRTM